MLQLTILITAALLFSFASLKLFFTPYIWICLSWLLVCTYATKHAKNTLTKAIAVNLGAVFLVFGSFEGFLYAQTGEPPRDEIRNQDGKIVKRTVRHNILGWAPIKNQVVFWRRYFGNTLLFDVVHTIDDNGLRISPEKLGRHPPKCILFFGGSFTFGAGVNDDETMSYLVGLRHHETFRVYNFGYSGYGVHQMLAALQHRIVDDTIDCQPKYAIYLGIPDHVRRSADKTAWANRAPKYLLGEDEKAIYSGQFERGSNSFAGRMKAQLLKSFIIRTLLEHRHVTSDDVRLLVAIVDTSRSLIEQRYAGSEFHVLIWNDENWISTEIVARLKRKRIRVHLVSEILPNYFNQTLKYVLSKEDGHPSRRAHKELAEYVSERIVQQ